MSYLRRVNWLRVLVGANCLALVALVVVLALGTPAVVGGYWAAFPAPTPEPSARAIFGDWRSYVHGDEDPLLSMGFSFNLDGGYAYFEIRCNLPQGLSPADIADVEARTAGERPIHPERIDREMTFALDSQVCLDTVALWAGSE